MNNFYKMIDKERKNQDRKWGIQRYEYPTWLTILTEEIGEVSRAVLDISFDDSRIRKRLLDSLELELVQVAAVCKAIWEQLDEERLKIGTEKQSNS